MGVNSSGTLLLLPVLPTEKLNLKIESKEKENQNSLAQVSPKS